MTGWWATAVASAMGNKAATKALEERVSEAFKDWEPADTLKKVEPMEESIPDALLKLSNVLHFLGRYRDANVMVLLSRWLRARGIETDDKLRYATEAAERDVFSREAMGTAAEPEAIAELGLPPEGGK